MYKEAIKQLKQQRLELISLININLIAGINAPDNGQLNNLQRALKLNEQIHKNKYEYNNFSLRILVSLDAKLAETISYQGERAIPSFLKQTNIQSKDEKYQQNRFLTEWLESIFSLGILPKKNIKNILDKNV